MCGEGVAGARLARVLGRVHPQPHVSGGSVALEGGRTQAPACGAGTEALGSCAVGWLWMHRDFIAGTEKSQPSSRGSTEMGGGPLPNTNPTHPQPGVPNKQGLLCRGSHTPLCPPTQVLACSGCLHSPSSPSGQDPGQDSPGPDAHWGLPAPQPWGPTELGQGPRCLLLQGTPEGSWGSQPPQGGDGDRGISCTGGGPACAAQVVPAQPIPEAPGTGLERGPNPSLCTGMDANGTSELGGPVTPEGNAPSTGRVGTRALLGAGFGAAKGCSSSPGPRTRPPSRCGVGEEGWAGGRPRGKTGVCG